MVEKEILICEKQTTQDNFFCLLRRVAVGRTVTAWLGDRTWHMMGSTEGGFACGQGFGKFLMATKEGCLDWPEW